jgi:hypothetical protein
MLLLMSFSYALVLTYIELTFIEHFLSLINRLSLSAVGLDHKIHHPLEPLHIRLLVLQPGKCDSEVRCYIQQANLKSLPSYEAVSYAWGDSDATHPIQCNGQKLIVSLNLYEALRAVRFTDKPRVIWIDGLCIDQSNVYERSDQIQLMRDIYAKASRVLIWLGAGSPEADSAIDFLEEIASGLDRKSRMKAALNLQSLDGFEFSRPTTPRCTSGKASMRRGDWDAVDSLLRQRWFQRTWVLQEVAHATNATLICGKRSIPWKTFTLVLEQYLCNGVLLDTLTDDARLAVEKVVEVNRIWGWSERFQSFLGVLLAVSGSGCTDPRDRIYALSTFARERCLEKYCNCAWHESFRTDDENRDVSEVFTRFAVWDMTRTETANFNCFSCATPKSKRASSGLEDLPSWVPDWINIENKHPFVRYTSRIPFAAGKGLEPDLNRSSYFEILDGKLDIAAMPIDCVGETGNAPSFEKLPHCYRSLEDLAHSVNRTREWISECRSIAYQERDIEPSKKEAFWKTMTCSLTGQGRSASKSYSNHFTRYCHFLDEISDAIETEKDSRCEELLREYGNDIAKIESSLHMWASKRRFTRTYNGRLAFVPLDAQEGDTIAVLPHALVPYVFRPGDDGFYTVIGEAYVHGAMNGETVKSGQYDICRFQIG